MTDIDIKKTKFKLEAGTFITICVVVFWLGVTWASLKSTQNQILDRLDTLTVLQQDMVATSDSQHAIIDKFMAISKWPLNRLSRERGMWDLFTN